MWDKRSDMVVHESEPYNAEPAPDVLIAHTVTPVDAFYSRNHAPVPQLDAASCSVAVGGLVERPTRLTVDQLRGFEPHTVTATLQCAGNRRAGLIAVRPIPGEDPWRDAAISTAEWTGVRLRDVLTAVGIAPGAAHVEFEAPDVSELAEPPQPFGASIPIHKAMGEEVLLAWAMNGSELPALHGGPIRVVVPGYIGARSVKWLSTITVRADPSPNYFQETAYRLLAPGESPAPGRGISLGPVALTAAILAPPDGATVDGGTVTVRGYAFAGDGRRIARVDVSGDGGTTWCQADLGPELGRWAWRLWHADVDVLEGTSRLVARAWDDTGALQPESPEHVWNPKGYANSSWPRVTVSVQSTS